MISVTRHYKIWFSISAFFIGASIIAIALWGLAPGIDFRGGVQAELTFEREVNSQQITEELQTAGFTGVVVQPVGERGTLIKSAALDEARLAKLKDTLQTKFGGFEEISFESIGPSIGRELTTRAYWQVILVVLGIVFYIAYAFRKIGQLAQNAKIAAWHLGMATIVALIHDIIIPLGLFAILGKYRAVEVDGLFITALLTILGFSVHDTIVVFDRIRENLQKYPHKHLATLIDYSVNSTLARSINTSSTLIFVLIAMLLFGGQTIFYFVLALLVGVTFGTYSSIFIASPILYLWHRNKT
ncbi:MAG: protein translocase subunit SecF [Candidatus Doudnabacteria bacterium]|nr:protein translocase subunit SecF [Candidatus Doudnabacteria bacterium]